MTRDDYVMVIDNGKAEATIAAAVFDAEPGMLDTLHATLNARFLGVQLLSRRPYDLRRPSTIRVREDGRRDIFIQVEGVMAFASLGALDTQSIDADGSVVADSRTDRIEKKRRFANLVCAYSGDQLLSALLASHSHSIADPNNELVHLYEIRDALSEQFGGDKNAKAALGVSLSDWSRLGQLFATTHRSNKGGTEERMFRRCGIRPTPSCRRRAISRSR